MGKESLFQCPVCSEALIQGEKQYFCKNGHSYDIARKGYVNLLLPGNTGAGVPGDSKEMIQSRRSFLNKGYYEGFSNQLNEIVTYEQLSANKTEHADILDAGCGEGYYTSRLKNKLLDFYSLDKISIYGVDVSKPAINCASGRDKDIRFAVASTYHVPVLTGSMDCIVCIFAPRDENEFRRVLKHAGKLIVVAPGSQHLYSLKEVLYENPDAIGQKGTAGEGFKLLDHINIAYDIRLKCTDDILNLFMMTPYCHHADSQAVEKLKKLNELVTEVDFNVMIYQKEG